MQGELKCYLVSCPTNRSSNFSTFCVWCVVTVTWINRLKLIIWVKIKCYLVTCIQKTNKQKFELKFIYMPLKHLLFWTNVDATYLIPIAIHIYRNVFRQKRHDKSFTTTITCQQASKSLRAIFLPSDGNSSGLQLFSIPHSPMAVVSQMSLMLPGGNLNAKDFENSCRKFMMAKTFPYYFQQTGNGGHRKLVDMMSPSRYHERDLVFGNNTRFW